MGLAEWIEGKHHVLPKRIVQKRGKVIYAAHRFPRAVAIQRGVSTSRALALLALPFALRRSSVVLERPEALRRQVEYARYEGPVEIPLGQWKRVRKEMPYESVRVARKGEVSASMPRVIRRRVPLPIKMAAAVAWRATACLQREQRREVLFARAKAGRGVSNRSPKRFTEKSKVRC